MSPVVATLVLIVIAIVGAVGVGLILSNVSHSVGQQAAGGGNGQSANSQLLLGGSTTLYPADEAAIKPFQAAFPGIKVVDAQGGSDAGMQGILSGALDIGAASSISAVNNLYNAIANNNVQGVTPNVVLVGGSGVVFGTTSTCTLTTGLGGGYTCSSTAGSIQASPLFDHAGTTAKSHTCLETTRDALALMYKDGVFYINGGACETLHGVPRALNSTFVLSAPGGNTTGPFVAVSRSDFGGTEDTACGYLNGDQGLSYSGGSGICGASANVGSGNLGVLTTTQACSASGTGKGVTPVGCVGFFDLGFAEGKSAQAAATCSSAGGSAPCGIFIVEVSTSGDTGTGSIAGTIDPLQRADKSAASGASSYAFTNMTTSNIDSFIKSALKTASTQNPQTLQYSQVTSAQKFFPDAAASSAKNPLDRTFYYVTNGTPTPAEQDWITFMTNYNAELYWLGAGYFSQYDFTSA